MNLLWNKGGDRQRRKPAFATKAGRIGCVPPGGARPQIAVPVLTPFPRRNGLLGAFTLVEVMIGTVVMTIMMVGLYAGFTYGFRETQLARQQARATQVIEEKMELIRLLNWDQVVNLPGYVPTNFTDSFYATNPTNTASGNFVYTGTVLITNAPITETYKNDMRMITVTVNWTSGKTTHSRSMSAFVSQYGMQKYVY